MIAEFLELDVRRRIYECVKGSPGVHFREIQRRVGVATGSADYHLHFLCRHGLLRSEKTGRLLRYYVTDTSYDREEKELLDILRQRAFRHILIYLIENRKANAMKIASDLGFSPSGLSWYLKHLSEKGIVKQNTKGRFRFYSIRDTERRKSLIKCIVTHKESFLDKIVDSFIEAWGEE